MTLTTATDQGRTLISLLAAVPMGLMVLAASYGTFQFIV